MGLNVLPFLIRPFLRSFIIWIFPTQYLRKSVLKFVIYRVPFRELILMNESVLPSRYRQKQKSYRKIENGWVLTMRQNILFVCLELVSTN
jgi:hypothetical protein